MHRTKTPPDLYPAAADLAAGLLHAARRAGEDRPIIERLKLALRGVELLREEVISGFIQGDDEELAAVWRLHLAEALSAKR